MKLKIVIATTVLSVTIIQAAFAAPTKPTLLAPYKDQSNVSLSSVYFNWNSINASNYRIVISQNAQFSGFVDTNAGSYCKDNTCYTATTTNNYLYKSLSQQGQTYYWKIRANNSTGAIWSDRSYFTTTGTATLTGASLKFPATGSGWSHTSGSPYHKTYTWKGFNGNTSKAINDSNALDLNLNYPSFNSDKGKAVYPIANGTVVLNNTSSGFVVVKHDKPLRLDNGTILNTWYSGYMHMSNRNKPVGSYVSTSDSIGTISSTGTDIVHLHFAIYKDGTTLQSLSIRSNLQQFAAKISYWY